MVQYVSMESLKRFGNRIREIRKIRKMTQERLAEKADLNASYISLVEDGKRSPSLATVEKIASGLGVEIYQLFVSLEPELMSNKEIFKKMREMIDLLEGRDNG